MVTPLSAIETPRKVSTTEFLFPTSPNASTSTGQATSAVYHCTQLYMWVWYKNGEVSETHCSRCMYQ